MFKIGLGVDIHPLSPSRPLVLCGVKISEKNGLLGHSDGDVALHALMDAILGACGLEDIGHFFPSTSEWQGASSLEMLKIVKSKMEDRGLFLVNADISLILEDPKVAPFREEMVRSLTRVFPGAQFALKATTCEGLGFVGKREGACAIAVVLLAPYSHD